MSIIAEIGAPEHALSFRCKRITGPFRREDWEGSFTPSYVRFSAVGLKSGGEIMLPKDDARTRVRFSEAETVGYNLTILQGATRYKFLLMDADLLQFMSWLPEDTAEDLRSRSASIIIGTIARDMILLSFAAAGVLALVRPERWQETFQTALTNPFLVLGCAAAAIVLYFYRKRARH